MIRINLLPVRAAQKMEMLKGQLVIFVLSLVLVVAVCAGIYVNQIMRIDAVKEDIRNNQDESMRLKKTIGEVSQFKKKQVELRGKLDVLDKIKQGRSGPVHLMDELSAAIPDKVWIDSFKESDGNITINGGGLNEEVVAEFLRNLESSNYYQNVELQVIQQDTRGPLKSQKFSLSCRVEAPPAANKAK
jgi:type IV pilus assembly protein PilN